MMEFGLKTKFEFQKEPMPEVQGFPKLQCVIGARITSVGLLRQTPKGLLVFRRAQHYKPNEGKSRR